MAAEGAHIDFMFLAPPPLPGRWIRYRVKPYCMGAVYPVRSREKAANWITPDIQL